MMPTAATPKFPMDGYADTCTGHGVPVHGTNDELGTGLDALCGECGDRLEQEMRLDAERIRRERVTPSACGCAARDHQHGSQYYTCLCCYGD